MHRTNLFNPWIHKHRATLYQGEHSKEKSKAFKKRDNFKLCYQGLQWGALYRPQKEKGRPSDLTHEKRTQKY